MLTYSCFSCSSSVEASIPEKPTIAFSGVRISWLILARKADFRRLDSSARSSAVVSSNSIFLRLVMTCEEPISVTGFPSSSRSCTAACASTQSILCTWFSTFTTLYSSFTLSDLPSIRSWYACSTLLRSFLYIFEKYCESGTANCSSATSPPTVLNSIGLLISHRIVLLIKSHFQGTIFATSSAIANLLFVVLNFCCALCKSVLSMQNTSIIPEVRVPFSTTS